MTRAQAQLLLSLAENRYDEGTDAISEMRRMGSTHAQRLLEDEEVLKKALEINRQDQERFANYFPKQPTALRQAIQQGPQPQIPQHIVRGPQKAAE